MLHILARLLLIAAVGVLAACGDSVLGVKPDAPPPVAPPQVGSTGAGEGSLIERLFGEKKQPGGGTIGVNAYLWRASLDTLSFLPIASEDPHGGVIIYNWYAPPETPDERIKVIAYILSRDLRADGLRVAVFRQRRAGSDEWREMTVAPETVRDLENAILQRARELRIAMTQP